MRVLLDANVIVTYLTKREDPYLDACEEIVRLCSERQIEGFVSLHTLSIVWYVMRKYPEQYRTTCIRELCRILELAGTDMAHVRNGLEEERFSDFEDMLQDICAQAVNADYLVTANFKDFKCGVIPPITPLRLLEQVKSSVSMEPVFPLVDNDAFRLHGDNGQSITVKQHWHGISNLSCSTHCHTYIILCII